MSGLTSPATERTYGTERACRAFGVPRSSYYAWKKITSPAHERPRPKKRGPKIGTPDQELLTLIRDDLATSPFSGEGHRKVWARLRVLWECIPPASGC